MYYSLVFSNLHSHLLINFLKERLTEQNSHKIIKPSSFLDANGFKVKRRLDYIQKKKNKPSNSTYL